MAISFKSYPITTMPKLFSATPLKINVLSMIAAERDRLCPKERALDQAKRIPTMANFITDLRRGHNVTKPSAALFEVLLNELTDELPSEMSTFSVDPNADVQPDPEPEPV